MEFPDCIFCDPSVVKGPNYIHDFGNWVLLLNRHQFLLGVCMLVSKTHREGLTSLSEIEVTEAYSILKVVEETLKKSFSPDWFNYLQTNNSVKHLHFHIIPRYQHPVQFGNEDFIDENFHGMPIERERLVSTEMTEKLIGAIRSNI